MEGTVSFMTNGRWGDKHAATLLHSVQRQALCLSLYSKLYLVLITSSFIYELEVRVYEFRAAIATEKAALLGTN